MNDKMKPVLTWFKTGMKLKALAIYHSIEIKPITVPGLRKKLIRILGEKEYNKIRQSNIKHKDLQEKYARLHTARTSNKKKKTSS